MRHFCLLLSLILPLAAGAQNEGRSLPDELRAQRNGQGTVVIHQSADIEKAVREGVQVRTARTDSLARAAELARQHAARQRQETEVFRIRVYTGSNSRDDKTKAYQIADQCRRAFPELGAYPSFETPRWVCNIGDFRTREEAQKYLSKVRAARIGHECRIVTKKLPAKKKN